MRPGDIIAERFELERVAGSGGMGVVYRARDMLTGATVALKVLRDQGPSEGERFAREGRVLAELSHPAIVRYVAHGATPSGDRYLAMEWLDGEDLGVRLAREGLTVAETVTVVSGAAEALAAAHAGGVVHRDVKPGNLFLLGGDVARVKVLDFGIARFASGAHAATRTGTLIGTPGYMAPEQARGDRQLDAAVDVFALGCVLFECLTGRAAFTGEHVMALLAKILLQDPPRVRELRPDAPEALDALCARMMAKDATLRLRDGAAVAAELAALGPLEELSERVARSHRAPALTAGEQRLLCVVLAGREGVVPGAPSAATVELAAPETLRATARAAGARLEQLADGSTVAILSGTGTATDQAAQAARCALALRALLPEAPMALATGRGDVSGRWPVGEAIDRAARLLRADVAAHRGASRASRIAIDEVTAGLLDARFDVGGDDAGLVLRGERPVPEVIRTLLGRPSPFVGRERELTTLAAILDECTGEPIARPVLLTAAAGVGKTRLRREFVAKVRARGAPVEVWLSRGDPLSAGSPFGLLAQAVRHAAGILEGEPLAVRQQRLRARVARHLVGDDVARVAEFLGELVGAPFPDEGSVQLRAARRDAMLMGDQMRRAWEDFLGAECAAQPVVLVLEDLHWGDLPTVKFVDSALRHLHDRPWLVVATARPEIHDQFPRLWSERGAQEIRLGELTRRACEKLVRAALGEGALPEVVARVVDQADGNALYLEELVRAAADGKGDALPETVRSMVQARLEALEAEARRILRAASVFGQVFWEGGLCALVGGASSSARQVDAWLAELVQREVIERKGGRKFANEAEYGFRHGVAREAAYAMLTEHDRVLGHQLAAAWLERAGERDAVVLAEHCERGQEPERAVGFYRRAAEQALEGNDFAAVLARAERGLACGATGDVRGALKLLQAEAHRWRGEHAEAEARGAEARAELRPGSLAWYTAAGEMAIACGRVGHHEPLAALGAALRAEVPTPDAAGPYVIAAARTVVQLLHAGRRELAALLLERVEEVAATLGSGEPAVVARVHEAHAVHAVATGDPGACLLLSEKAAASFEAAGDVRNACNQRINAGYASVETGGYEQAEAALRDALAAAERMGLSNVSAFAKHNLGLALARAGKLDEARRVEAQAVAALMAQGDRRLEGAARIYLAEILALGGDLPAAEREADAAVRVTAASPPFLAYALATLASVRLRRGDVAGASEPAREAAALLGSLAGVDDGEALIRLVPAEALHAAGQLEPARAAIAAARERLLARAARISDAALRESFLARVPDNARTLALAAAWLPPA